MLIRDMIACVLATSKCRRGATAIEYGLIAGFISILIAGVVVTIGTDLNTLFTTISTALKGG